MSTGAAADEQRALRLLRAHGTHPFAFRALGGGLQRWCTADGFVPFHDTGLAWVSAGPPVAPQQAQARMLSDFHRAGRAAGRRVRGFALQAELVTQAGWRGFNIGAQPEWDPRLWPGIRAGSRSLREQLRRARAKGVRVVRLAPEAALGGWRAPIERLSERWLAQRPMAPMGFVVSLDLFRCASERHYFAALQAGELVGVLAAAPVYAREGWFLEHLLRDPDAPNGTTELLVDAAMQSWCAQSAPFATLGLAPLSGEVGATLRWVARLGKPLYHFDGVRAFKAKFCPSRWVDLQLAYPPGAAAPHALWDLLAAFAPGGMAAFAWQTLEQRMHDPAESSTFARHDVRSPNLA